MQPEHILPALVAYIQETIECELSGSCRFAAQEMTQSLLAAGIKDFEIVEGFVRQPGNRHVEQHTWIKVGEEIVDPTFVQFAEGSTYDSIKRSYKPHEYQIPHPKDVEFEAKHPNYRAQYYKQKPVMEIS